VKSVSYSLNTITKELQTAVKLVMPITKILLSLRSNERSVVDDDDRL